MTMDRSKYPANWEEFSRFIRFDRAKQQCECTGECGLHDGRDLFFPEAKRCEERLGFPAKWATGTIVLSVAHLNRADGPCKCDPLCTSAEHVKAMCSRCHLRYDIERHVENRKKSDMTMRHKHRWGIWCHYSPKRSLRSCRCGATQFRNHTSGKTMTQIKD